MRYLVPSGHPAGRVMVLESTSSTESPNQPHSSGYPELCDSIMDGRGLLLADEGNCLVVTYIVGPVSILCDDMCTRVLRMPRNRKNICVVIYTYYHMLLYNIAINTSHVIDCKESQTVQGHTCLEMSSRHYYIRIVTFSIDAIYWNGQTLFNSRYSYILE
jgi:hypothetical protein